MQARRGRGSVSREKRGRTDSAAKRSRTERCFRDDLPAAWRLTKHVGECECEAWQYWIAVERPIGAHERDVAVLAIDDRVRA